MKTELMKETDYHYPEELVALKPKEPCRVLLQDHEDSHGPKEIDFHEISQVFESGDLLVINNSGVKACRVFYEGRELLFLKESQEAEWEVMFRSKGLKVGDRFSLPDNIEATLISKGRPQTIKLNKKITPDYFHQYGQMALPPYIQKNREQRENLQDDSDWYQLDWKKNENSLAAPTASLHFKKEDLLKFQEESGVKVVEVSLDVGLGTFLPLEDKNFEENRLHKERFFIPKETRKEILNAIDKKRRVWALGTTALRAVESMSATDTESQNSETELFIQPGYEFRYISGLLTNFHQPKSSLLLLVMAFFGIEKTKQAYRFAIENKFRLFSYGDLSIWKRPKI